MTKKKNTRGGAGRGQGRKSDYDEPTKPIKITIPADPAKEKVIRAKIARILAPYKRKKNK